MSNLMSLIRRAPKRFSAMVAIIAAAVIVPAAVLAWGPTDRPTFTMKEPATYNTFNSIVNNPDYGDERNFVRIKDASDTGPGNWSDKLTVDSDKEYLVQMYVHNNAADNLNKVAENVKVMANVPNTTGKQVQIDGFITSSNATPNKIWDQAIFTSSKDFNLTYVPGSAVLYNNVFGKTGAKLSDGIVTSNGATVGYDKLDGKIPGCFKYSGYVSFKVKAQVAKTTNFTLKKSVSKHGAAQWDKNYKAQPGETVDFALTYRNTGEVRHDDVTFRDALPAGLTYVKDSAKWNNASHKNMDAGNDLTTGVGVNVGSYAPGANAWVIFSAKVAPVEQLACGTNTLTNKGKVNTGGYAVEDTATVTVDKDCKPEPKFICKALGITQVDRTNFRFSTSYTAENAKFKSVTYVIKNAAGQTVDTKTSTNTTLNYTQATVGKYTVQASVTFTVDGKDKTVTSENCKGSFEVKKEDKNITVCELATKKIVTIKESQFDSSKYSKNLDDCKEKPPVKIEVCDLTTKKIVTINEKDFDSSKYSKNLKDCESVPPAKIKVCDLTTKQVVTIDEKNFDESKYSKDLSKCAETPVTPPELPKTGIGENIVAVVGLGALIASAAYYIASRRALNQ